MSKTQSVTGRAIGGKARSAKMTPEQRKEQAAKMVAARQAKAAMPKVIHKKLPLILGDVQIPCAVIQYPNSEVKRVLTENGILTAIYGKAGMASGASKRGREKALNNGVAPMPLFLSPERLRPLILEDETLSALLLKIEYMDDKEIVSGYDASILPSVCEIWLKARDMGILQSQQLGRAQKAELLMRALAHIGIIALVDEATGYQDVRSKDALAKILEAFVAKELQPWVKTFPLEYYKELCRLYNVPFPPLKNNQFPQFFGHITNNAVYTRLAPELLPELKKAASKQEKKAKLHQLLTQDVGHPKLKEHLASVVTLLKLAKDKDDFSRMLDIVHPKLNNTIPLDLGE